MLICWIIGLLAFLGGGAGGFLLSRARPAATGRADDAALLAELRKRSSTLRHDMRGVLSPALLVSDRLLTHEDAHVRRAGEVMTRTVERATQLLASTRLDEPPTPG